MSGPGTGATTVDTFGELANPSAIGSNDVLYVISKPSTGIPVDKKVTAGVLASYILGSQELSGDIDGNSTITIRDTSGNRKLAKVITVEQHLFGTQIIPPADDVMFRVVSSNDPAANPARGGLTFKDLTAAINVPDEAVTVLDPAKDDVTSIRITIDETNSSVPIVVLEKYFLGSEVDVKIEPTDFIYKKSANGVKTLVEFKDVLTSILPMEQFFGDDKIDNTMNFVVSSADGSSRGIANLETIMTYIVKTLDIPTYESSDNVTSNVTFMYRDSTNTDTKYGYMTEAGLKKLILLNDSRTIAQDTSIRVSNSKGEDGLIQFSAIKTDIVETVSGLYGVDPTKPMNDINPGDGIIFAVNNSGGGTDPAKYENISFTTLRDKIIGVGNTISITNDTQIVCNTADGPGTITYAEFYKKLHFDLFGN